MLTEEIGEIATELKPLWSDNYGDFDPARLQDEIADAFVLLSALATRFNIDIDTAATKKTQCGTGNQQHSKSSQSVDNPKLLFRTGSLSPIIAFAVSLHIIEKQIQT